MRSLLPALAALLILAAPAAAKTYDVPAEFGDVLPAVSSDTKVPVLLPDRMPYWIQARVGGKDTERRILVRMADQAIRAGAR